VIILPNWCANDLKITGPKKELERFKEAAKSENEELSADKFIPYPDKFKKQDEEAKKNPELRDGFNQGGYEWCIENWGTKWGFCNTELVREKYFKNGKGQLLFCFDTAWSPIIPVIRKMGEMFPQLKFDLRYFEGAMNFQGKFQMENGKVIMEESSDYYGNRGG
jgi:hypothetical protein